MACGHGAWLDRVGRRFSPCKQVEEKKLTGGGHERGAEVGVHERALQARRLPKKGVSGSVALRRAGRVAFANACCSEHEHVLQVFETKNERVARSQRRSTRLAHFLPHINGGLEGEELRLGDSLIQVGRVGRDGGLLGLQLAGGGCTRAGASRGSVAGGGSGTHVRSGTAGLPSNLEF